VVLDASWQYSLQYLLSAFDMQLQAGCAHFWFCDIVLSARETPKGLPSDQVFFRNVPCSNSSNASRS
jgi:hypothetical protein